MHIGIVTAQYFPHVGGVETFTKELTKTLIDRGHRVTIITSRLNKECKWREITDGVRIIRMPALILMGGRYPFAVFGPRFVHQNHYVKSLNYDMILINTRFYPLSVYGARLARKMRVPCVTLDHGSGHMKTSSRFLNVIEIMVEHMITKVGQLYCSHYYGVSEESVKWLRHFHIKADGVISNAIDLDEFDLVAENPTIHFRRQYNIGQNSVIITFIGRMIAGKGIFKLLEAVKDLQKSRSDVYLILAGDGGEYERVRAMTNDHIITVGSLNYPAVVTLLKEADIFCLPSDSEGWGMTLAEAAAAECYIVSTRVGIAQNLIPDDDHGTIIDNNSVHAIREAIKQAINIGYEERKRRAKKTRENLVRQYTWDQTVKTLEQIVSSLKQESD